ncbi:MAG: acyl--CoA ligase [Clostridia bacterium]|nr:acyl--CoA ligase [Clostridia bacterium]
MPITDILRQNVRLYGNDDAIIELNYEADPNKSWSELELVQSANRYSYRCSVTWREFDDMANRFANYLISLGIKKDDKVAILLMNCLEWLPAYFGILKTGAWAVPLNYRIPAEEIKYSLEKSEASVLLFGESSIERIDSIKDSLTGIRQFVFTGSNKPGYAVDFANVISQFPADDPNIPLTDDDFAAIYFSSGTTGLPKAILHKHQSLMCACITEQKHHGQTKDDIFLCIPPLYHTGAKMHWFGSFLVGGKAVLLRGSKAEWILRAASDEKVSIVWLTVPWTQDVLMLLEENKVDISKYDFSNWRMLHIGAQPVPPSLISRWFKQFPNHQYDTNYGLSESIGPGCVHLGVENTHKVGAIGVPGYGWQVKIIDENGNEVPQGEAGELCVKGPGVMTCYYHDEEATNASLKDGWLLTGDVAMMDEDGFIYLVDRKKDVIIMGGENIYPVQIESYIMKHPAVKSVGVIGSYHARLGEIPIAVVELKDGAYCTEEELDEFCQGLPRFKRPKKYIFAPVPHNPTGKIEKPKLREMYGGVRLVAMQNEIK